MDNSHILPDCRTKRRDTFILMGEAGVWIPIFCANCGAPGGCVPEENVTFDFYLCNKCVETHGAIANTMLMPDEVFWAQVAADQEGKRQREEERGNVHQERA